MAPSFVIYIDESGDEGLFGKAGSSEWLVLSAAVTRKRRDHELLPFMDKLRQDLGLHAKKAVHFRKLRHERKVAYCERVGKEPIRLVTVLAHKPSIQEPERFREQKRLYFYVARFLLERASWLCRDHAEADGCSAEVVFSNRSSISYEELRAYLRRLKELSETQDIRIDWSAINPEKVIALPAGKRVGLQLADAAASAYSRAVEPNAYGHTEDRYARLLRPVTYQEQGCYFGYGVKLWPSEVKSLLQEQRFAWLREDYGVT